MTINTMKAPTPARVDALEMLSSAASVSTYPTFALASQEPTDMVGILAAVPTDGLDGVEAATVRALLAAWQIGCRS